MRPLYHDLQSRTGVSLRIAQGAAEAREGASKQGRASRRGVAGMPDITPGSRRFRNRARTLPGGGDSPVRVMDNASQLVGFRVELRNCCGPSPRVIARAVAGAHRLPLKN